MNHKKSTERRKHPRFRLLTGLQYKLKHLPDAEQLSDFDRLLTTHVQDASMGGLGALLERFAPPESILEVHLQRTPKSKEQITVEARVLWCDKTPRPEGGFRCGLEFLMPSETAIRAIMALLETADKTPLE